MPFYIRKAFKTGPIRLNLSKGGLGLSGGITGARVGINSKGTYVHGGRHGLYYRKYARKGRSRSSSGGNNTPQRGSSAHQGPVNHFVDTGVTFTPASVGKRLSGQAEPALPELTIMNTPVKAAIIAVLLIFLLGVIGGMEFVIVGAAVVGLITLGWSARELIWRRRVNRSLDMVLTHLEEKKNLPEIPLLQNPSLPDRWRGRFSLHLHAAGAELAMRNKEIDTLSVLEALDENVPAEQGKIDRFRAAVFGKILDEFLEDHILSKEEETTLRELMNQLDLPKDYLAIEQERLEQFSEVRRQMERSLEPMTPDVPLLRGEEAYELFDHARLLKERVLHRYQRNNVQYRELGYEIDMEGKMLLTDRRLLIINRGSREYRLNRVLDVTVDPEAGIAELTLSNRKSPVIISTKKPLLFAARVEKVIEEIV